MPPDLKFIPDSCYWPEEVGLEEKFVAKWAFNNQGSDGEGWLGISYKGKNYVLQISGQNHWPILANETKRCHVETTIRDWFKGVDEFKETTTIELTYYVGYYDESQAETPYWYTDTWTARTYVKVGGGLPVPTWMLMAGAGLGLVAITGVVIATRKKK
jgi:hypothetical protein